MTTIAYKDGLMAGDSCHSDVNGWYATSMSKISRTSAGALLGGAGDVDGRAVEKLLDKVKTFNQMPTRQELGDTRTDGHYILALPNGEVAQICIEFNKDINQWTGCAIKVNRGGTSVGSGSGVAMGAMDAGKTAREAVEYATRRDPMTKAPVHVMELRPVPTKAARARAGKR